MRNKLRIVMMVVLMIGCFKTKGKERVGIIKKGPNEEKLYRGVLNKNIEELREAINEGAEIDIIRDDNFTPLLRACNDNSIEIVKKLLDKKAYVFFVSF